MVLRSSLVEDSPSVIFFIVVVNAVVVSDESISLMQRTSQNTDVQWEYRLGEEEKDQFTGF